MSHEPEREVIRADAQHDAEREAPEEARAPGRSRIEVEVQHLPLHANGLLGGGAQCREGAVDLEARQGRSACPPRGNRLREGVAPALDGAGDGVDPVSALVWRRSGLEGVLGTLDRLLELMRRGEVDVLDDGAAGRVDDRVMRRAVGPPVVDEQAGLHGER